MLTVQLAQRSDISNVGPSAQATGFNMPTPPAAEAQPSPLAPATSGPLVRPSQVTSPGQMSANPTGGETALGASEPEAPALATTQFHWRPPAPPKIGAGLFPNDWHRMSLNSTYNALHNRFGPCLDANDLVCGLNMSSSDANRFIQHHGTNGKVDLRDLMDHVSRFAGRDGKINRGEFETAMRNGANSLNFSRFEPSPGQGIDLNGFMEMARRAGAQAPDHLLSAAFHRAASSGCHSDRALLDPGEMARFFGVRPDHRGDVDARDLARGVDRAATPPPFHGWNPWRPRSPWR